MSETTMAVMIDELKQKLKVLATENANLRYERDWAKAQAVAHLPIATPEQEAELERVRKTGVPDGLAKLLTELEAEHG